MTYTKQFVFSLQMLNLAMERMCRSPVLGLAEIERLAGLITVALRGLELHLCPEPPLLEKPPLLCFSPGLSPPVPHEGETWHSLEVVSSLRKVHFHRKKEVFGGAPSSPLRPCRRWGRLLPLGAASASRCARVRRRVGPGRAENTPGCRGHGAARPAG